MWFGWSVPVVVCTTVYFLVAITGNDQDVFWPLWVAGPLGAVLFCVTMMERFMIRPMLDEKARDRARRRGDTGE